MQVTTLREEHAVLVQTRKALEDDYLRFVVEEVGIEKKVALAKIKQAREAPTKIKRLIPIHKAHKAVLEKETVIEVAEGKMGDR